MTRLDPQFLTTPLTHRGLHTPASFPENSQGAFQAALDDGYGIELDVQISSDGRAMVFHDDTLDRLTSQSGPTNGRTAAQLQRLTLGQSTQTIPTLQDTLKLVGGRAPLLIEIKDQDHTLGPNVGALEAAVARDLAHYDGPVAVMSFNPYSTAEMAKRAPRVPRGLTTCAFTPDDWPAVPQASLASLAELPIDPKLGIGFISHDRRDLDRPRIAQLRAAGLAILCWTVTSLEQEQDARRFADNITFESYAAPKAQT